MIKTTYKITQMDCPSEENLIRMQLDSFTSISRLDFDISQRQLVIIHRGEQEEDIHSALSNLHLGEQKIRREELNESELPDEESLEANQSQRRMLLIVLLINFSFFALEAMTGIFSHSMGLVADSLDMLADALVYGISLLAVGKSLVRKKRAARTAGYLQVILAGLGLAEILRRFYHSTELPNPLIMVIVSALAMIANGVCLILLQKSQNKEDAHLKASLIFTSNDLVINLGVILAGILVYISGNPLPDLIIGIIVFLVVTQGALRILKLGK